MKESGNFANFEGWADGYGAFTYTYREKEMIRRYIKNQEKHHMKVSFREEYIYFLIEFEVDFDERYIL